MKKVACLLVKTLVALFFVFRPLLDFSNVLVRKFYSEWMKRSIKKCSLSSVICYKLKLIGGQYITIGKDTTIGPHTSLYAWHDGRYKKDVIPEIRIGDSCDLGAYTFITAVDKIIIGNNVLFGRNVLVTDNSHGDNSAEHLMMSPRIRPLISKGIVVIEDNVWVGEKVCILPGVRIGKNSVIAANSVVTKNIPPNCVAAGVPARIIKNMACGI